MIEFEFADLHCHPTLKPFGQSFGPHRAKATIWRRKLPTRATLLLQRITGITRFSQADFKSMAEGGVRYAFVSLYPFEKAFFTASWLPDMLSAHLASWITSIGVKRVSYIQRHTNYFEDLMGELRFLERTARSCPSNPELKWGFLKPGAPLNHKDRAQNYLHVIPTIEGAHVLNTGLGSFGREVDVAEVIDNISQLQLLPHPPLFITLAHNFANDLCGHAPSLQVLGKLANQSAQMGTGITPLGYRVLHLLLHPKKGRKILIDLKHMSLKAREQYFNWHESQCPGTPILVSHGALNGPASPGESSQGFFVHCEINFNDPELIRIARSGGLFGVQLDAKRLVPKAYLKNPKNGAGQPGNTAYFVWTQIRHAAEVLDSEGLPSWGTLCIGSDFDGTINPLPGIWSVREFNILANRLLEHVRDYLSNNPPLLQKQNRELAPEQVIHKFCIGNAEAFLERHWCMPDSADEP